MPLLPTSTPLTPRCSARRWSTVMMGRLISGPLQRPDRRMQQPPWGRARGAALAGQVVEIAQTLQATAVDAGFGLHALNREGQVVDGRVL